VSEQSAQHDGGDEVQDLSADHEAEDEDVAVDMLLRERERMRIRGSSTSSGRRTSVERYTTDTAPLAEDVEEFVSDDHDHEQVED
ncbi:unnamed protein product, partial [Amoebophrya sp. A25]